MSVNTEGNGGGMVGRYVRDTVGMSCHTSRTLGTTTKCGGNRVYVTDKRDEPYGKKDTYHFN